ncbi:MAG: NUDIX domain-containing protein [Gemmatimonadetes bacterium]|nr:CoA pyrophosphatase [Gemmatimonadota bacterium]NIQ58610.1 CoA pyrophosphatase [Gemmatimonadota bacterium]NIU78800.1 NUDIX domain-containing protein [Gammaproteobacteria bacterium]NIX47612.1 NUDIX domain-containing protein [Gemmatimonadota bacterium]NIY11975.1 NUDIX domain-containing protein [Gemmatimonadota bacterium]
MDTDPRVTALRHALDRRTPMRGPRDPSLSEAAVLLALRPTDPLELLLIERAEKEGDPWSGHMALPGGRREPDDGDLLATALRETREETRIDVSRDAVLGGLDELRPGARRRFSIVVTPFVAVVPLSTEAVPAPNEVETALWVPLPHLASDEAVDEILIDLEEESLAFPALSYQDYIIWGLTHRILTDFMDVAREAGVV